MAQRPVYLKYINNPMFESKIVDFKFFSGFSITQKQRSVESLHASFALISPQSKILEVSSASSSELGVKLSAFNLYAIGKSGNKYSVESMYQASKVFEKGGPYIDLLGKTSSEAKKDVRIRESGNIIGFKLNGKSIPVKPKSLCYNWIYINTLNQNPELAKQIIEYDAFTDISFNPKKSINCQAESCAIYVSLVELGLLERALASINDFVMIVYGKNSMDSIEKTLF